MITLTERDSEGKVTVLSNDGKKITATIPRDRSMLGITGVNGLIHGGEYKLDGWVYLNGIPVRKWHIQYEGVKLWEPKFQNLPALYVLYKKTRDANHAAWERIQEVLDKLWSNHKQGDVVKAHAKPIHYFQWNKTPEPWWEYEISDYRGEGVGFSFRWLDEKPKHLINHDLGEKLYKRERWWYQTTSNRMRKVRNVFYEAMKRFLPKATEHKKVVSLQFGDDTFWFYTVSNGSNAHWWQMFNDQYQFEIKKIV